MVKTWASTQLEQSLRRQGHAVIAGVDEVGRGALAGPLVIGCVVMSPNFDLAVCDSKLLDRPRRAELAAKIKTRALDYSFGQVSSTEIDELGLAAALKLGYLRAIEALNLAVSHWVLDGNVNYLAEFACASAAVRGDQYHSCVAAASIIAKVERDNQMIAFSQRYPGYGFERHVGYGTAAHRAAIARLGLTELHRRRYIKP